MFLACLTIGLSAMTDIDVMNISTFAKTTSKSKSSKKSKPASSSIVTLYTDNVTGEWIQQGKKNIVVHRDAEGKLRAMSPYSLSASNGAGYAEMLKEFQDTLADTGVRIYTLIAPSQGAYYLPPQVEGIRSQTKAIKDWESYLAPGITMINVCDTLENHKDEEIYSRTDHHWAPLGAYYAAKAIAAKLNLPFLSLDKYTPATVRNYIGTMYTFSGNREILNYPEDFVYFFPPGNYYAEFIDYKGERGKSGFSESEPHEGSVFRKYEDGNSNAYSTYLGGDRHTVKIVNRENKSGRKLLLVKDSYGNAIAPNLINSAEEVHVIDFRYYPHKLKDYIADNGITDLIFVNCIGIGFSSGTPPKFKALM